ncbi:MAG: hypothetical protein V1917_00705 [Candidatus Gottesmanbacteria bacterium]
MPKKTKKAKLIAEYRRKLQRLDDVPHIEQTPSLQQPARSIFTLPVLAPTLSTTTTTLSFPETESRAIRKDLVKTLIVVFLFIVFELFLSKILR